MKSIEQIQNFEKTIGQLNVLIGDFSELSKKKPDGPVNKFKISLVNSILEKLNQILDDENKPFNDFTLFSEEEFTSNSDILVILNLYHNSSKGFAEKNVESRNYNSHWVIDHKISNQVVSLPELFKEKDG